MNLTDIHTHLLHNLHTITEAEHSSLLGSTYNMTLAMFVEVESVDRASYLLILEHTFSTVAERKNDHTLATDRYTCSQIVHLLIVDTFSCNISFNPCIKNTGTIYTQQHTQTILFCCMIHMSKSIYTTKLVIIHSAEHTIY